MLTADTATIACLSRFPMRPLASCEHKHALILVAAASLVSADAGDLALLQHDKPLAKGNSAPHLKHIPAYLRDPTLATPSFPGNAGKGAVPHLLVTLVATLVKAARCKHGSHLQSLEDCLVVLWVLQHSCHAHFALAMTNGCLRCKFWLQSVHEYVYMSYNWCPAC